MRLIHPARKLLLSSRCVISYRKMAFDKVPQDAKLKVDPYTLKVPEEDVQHFYQLIKLSKLAPKTYENLQKDTLTFGVTHEWMSQAKQHWSESYDWRSRENHINSFPNFQTSIQDDNGDTFSIHFAALFSTKPDATPIVFLHGWPGSFLEFLGVLDLARKKYPNPETLPYHIIAPSLPGYGLSSGPPTDKNWKVQDIARIIDKLMTGLFPQIGYIAQGGDIGAYTCRPLSKYPSCKGIHLNFSLMSKPLHEIPDSELTDKERTGLKQTQEFASTQSAYALEHGTRPATIGFVLSSSPIALLAWIGEKFITWTDETPSLDDILDSITLYWFTESFARCIYPYRQFHGQAEDQYTIHDDPEYYIEKPLGYSYFPCELAPMPRKWVETTGRLVWYRLHERGGHFAAMERPELMFGDVEEFVQQVRES